MATLQSFVLLKKKKKITDQNEKGYAYKDIILDCVQEMTVNIQTRWE
jgi:hypothetical protein